MVNFKRVFINSPILLTLFFYTSFYLFYLFEIFSLDSALSSIYFSFFHIFSIMSILSFLMVSLTSPGFIPLSFDIDKIPDSQKLSLSPDFNEADFAFGRLTFCKKCDKMRPVRAHHCSTCEKCILRFDHHCPFVANCIGINNHKSFILFLVYSSISLGFLSISSIYIMIDENTATWYFVGVGISILFFYLCSFSATQIWMLCNNLTTIEMNRNFNIFDLGKYLLNFQVLFEKNWWLWPLPFNFEQPNGIWFPVNVRSKSGKNYYFENKYFI